MSELYSRMLETGGAEGLLIIVFLLISGFFSASETALTAVSRARIYQLVKDGSKKAALVSRLRLHKESLIGTVLICNNLVNTAAAAVATSFSIKFFGDGSMGLAIATAVIALLIIVFSEILPKTYAIQNAERVSMMVSPVLSVAVKVFYPLTYCIQVFIHSLLKCFGVDISKTNTLISATDVIRGTIELHHREGKMVKQDRDMLGSILDLNDIEVRDIMVHRKQVDMINAELPPEKIIDQVFSHLHSRIPLWKGNADNVVGILYVKDLMRAIGAGVKIDNAAILALAHKPWFVPETTSLRDQLLAFRARRQHFAVVVDEYGALLGIVTLEDIIEEIVGEIDDEHDERVVGGVQKAGDGVYFVAGNMSIRDLNRELDWDLPDEHASTIAGLVIHTARVIPAKGQNYTLAGFRFTVVDKSATQIKRLKIERLSADATKDDAEL